VITMQNLVTVSYFERAYVSIKTFLARWRMEACLIPETHPCPTCVMVPNLVALAYEVQNASYMYVK